MELAEGNQKTVGGEFECEYDVEEIEEEVEEYEEEEVEEEEEEMGGGGLDRSAGQGEGVGSGDRRGDSPRKRSENVDNGEEEMKQADAAISSAGKIFVGGVAWDTSEETFSRHFSKYGEITDSVIMKDKNTLMPRGFGFVTYADPSIIDKVLEDEHVIDGRIVEVKRTVPREEMPSKAGIKTKKIFVGGIPTSLTEDELKEHFSSYGEVVEHQIMFDHTTGRSRGFGFVTFKDEESVDKIISKGKMHDFDGKQVEIKRAEPKRSGGNQRKNERASYEVAVDTEQTLTAMVVVDMICIMVEEVQAMVMGEATATAVSRVMVPAMELTMVAICMEVGDSTAGICTVAQADMVGGMVVMAVAEEVMVAGTTPTANELSLQNKLSKSFHRFTDAETYTMVISPTKLFTALVLKNCPRESVYYIFANIHMTDIRSYSWRIF